MRSLAVVAPDRLAQPPVANWPVGDDDRLVVAGRTLGLEQRQADEPGRPGSGWPKSLLREPCSSRAGTPAAPVL